MYYHTLHILRTESYAHNCTCIQTYITHTYMHNAYTAYIHTYTYIIRTYIYIYTHAYICNAYIDLCHINYVFGSCSADEDIDSKFPTNIVVYSNGTVNWVPLGLFISSCAINIKWFPFDDQFCDMKFGSWTYDGSKINLTTKDDKIETYGYQSSGEWDLISKTNVSVYMSMCLCLCGCPL